jgi:2-dehydropantoate 2-reductase
MWKNPCVGLPGKRDLSALAFICVSREEYGSSNHQDFGRLVIGRYPSGPSEKVLILRDLFARAGLKCEADDDIRTARWKKLIWNAPFNPMSVLTGGGSTYEMMNSESTLKVVREVMVEVVKLAGALGHHIPESFITKNLEDTAVMKPYKTSMLLDFERKQPMEVEPILGVPVRLARQSGVDVPHMETLYGLLSLIDRKNTGRFISQGRPPWKSPAGHFHRKAEFKDPFSHAPHERARMYKRRPMSHRNTRTITTMAAPYCRCLVSWICVPAVAMT